MKTLKTIKVLTATLTVITLMILSGKENKVENGREVVVIGNGNTLTMNLDLPNVTKALATPVSRHTS